MLIGYFEDLDAERAIAWRAADSFALREFLGLGSPNAPPNHSTISRTRRFIDLATQPGGVHLNAAAARGPSAVLQDPFHALNGARSRDT